MPEILPGNKYATRAVTRDVRDTGKVLFPGRNQILTCQQQVEAGRSQQLHFRIHVVLIRNTHMYLQPCLPGLGADLLETRIGIVIETN